MVGCKFCPRCGRLGILGPQSPNTGLLVGQRFHTRRVKPRRPAPPPEAGVSLQEKHTAIPAAERSTEVLPWGRGRPVVVQGGEGPLALFVVGSGALPCLPDSTVKSKAAVTWWGAIT